MYKIGRMFNEEKYKIGKLYRIASLYFPDYIRVFDSNELNDEIIQTKQTTTGFADKTVKIDLKTTQIRNGAVVMVVKSVRKFILNRSYQESKDNLTYRHYYKCLMPNGRLCWIAEIFLSELESKSS